MTVQRETSRLRRRLDAVLGDIAADHRPPTRALEVGTAGSLGVLDQRFGPPVALDLADTSADPLRLPFRDEEFDLVVCVDVLERADDADAALRELVRVSSRHLLLSAPHQPFSRATSLVTGRGTGARGGGRPRQHWTGAGFQRFVSRAANVRAVASPYPWTIVWATRL